MTELATDYMEGTLPLRTRIAARYHLLLCSMCRAHFDQLRKMARLLQNTPLEPPPAEQEAQLLAAATPPTGRPG
jgi:hypothetical protein